MEYWIKQTRESQKFADLGWDKPERKDQAGRLLVIGGNIHGFADPAKAFQYASDEGIGYARICLPDALKRTLMSAWVDAVFCPSTPSGSFAADSKELILQNALWADGILISGDFGRNSETAMLLDNLVTSIKAPTAITRDGLDYFLTRPKLLLERPDTVVVASFSQLQKLFIHAEIRTPLTYTMPLQLLAETLHAVTLEYPASIVTKFGNKYIVAHNGNVSTTDTEDDEEIWRLRVASQGIVNVLHHPKKPFEALSYSVART